MFSLFLTLAIASAHASGDMKRAPLVLSRGVSATETNSASLAMRRAKLWSPEPGNKRESSLLPRIPASRSGLAKARTPDGEVVAQCAGRNDTEVLAKSIKAANGQWIVIANGTTCAVAEITIPNLRIERGGLLKPLSGHTVVIAGTFDAGLYKVFENALAGD